jgi:hypothetical protein
MKKRLALLAVVAMVTGIEPTMGQEPPGPGSTLKSLMDFLVQNQGADAIITDAIILGNKGSGEEFSIFVPGGSLQLLSIPYYGAVCATWVHELTSGAYVFRWCANRRRVNGVDYEVQKDWYESAGSLRIKRKWLLDCQNSTDFQSLPDPAKALCP